MNPNEPAKCRSLVTIVLTAFALIKPNSTTSSVDRTLTMSSTKSEFAKEVATRLSKLSQRVYVHWNRFADTANGTDISVETFVMSTSSNSQSRVPIAPKLFNGSSEENFTVNSISLSCPIRKSCTSEPPGESFEGKGRGERN